MQNQNSWPRASASSGVNGPVEKMFQDFLDQSYQGQMLTHKELEPIKYCFYTASALMYNLLVMAMRQGDPNSLAIITNAAMIDLNDNITKMVAARNAASH